MGVRDYLNNKSNYLINWNRPGALLFGNHRYTPRELLERGFVITMTAAGGFLNRGSLTSFSGGAALGFLLAHSITMSPLIYKRLEAMWACDSLKDQIHLRLLARPADFRPLVTDVVDKVLQETHSKSPSAVWGRRKRLLTNLLDWLNDKQLSLEQLTPVLQCSDVINHLDAKDLSDSIITASPPNN